MLILLANEKLPAMRTQQKLFTILSSCVVLICIRKENNFGKTGGLLVSIIFYYFAKLLFYIRQRELTKTSLRQYSVDPLPNC